MTRTSRSRSDSGSVLMEYVVLCCGIGVVLLAFFNTQFYNTTDGYVERGLEWAASVQLLHRAISIPIP